MDSSVFFLHKMSLLIYKKLTIFDENVYLIPRKFVLNLALKNCQEWDIMEIKSKNWQFILVEAIIFKVSDQFLLTWYHFEALSLCSK